MLVMVYKSCMLVNKMFLKYLFQNEVYLLIPVVADLGASFSGYSDFISALFASHQCNRIEKLRRSRFFRHCT